MLSIIIPVLNEEKYLPRLLESIKSQSFVDYEIIVSDGGSIDKTRSIAEEFGTKFLVNTKIKHPSAQRNNGAAIANGDTLLFLDADSVLSPDFLVNACKEFREQKLKAAGFYVQFNPNKFYYNIYSVTSNVLCYLKQFSNHPAAVGAGLMSDKEAHKKINGFDLEVLLAEDYDYCERLSRIGKFRMIKSTRLLYSSRRIEKEGFWQAGWKWIKMGLFTLTHRRIKKQIIKYDFGKF
jgi:glycosyltransferase involved in cell wall biosynthesis